MGIKSGKSSGLLDKDKIKGYKAICNKHGDVTNASFYFDYSVKNNETGKEDVYRSIYCLPCLNEYLMSLQEAGKIPKVELYPVSEEELKEEEEKEPEIHESPTDGNI